MVMPRSFHKHWDEAVVFAGLPTISQEMRGVIKSSFLPKSIPAA